MTPPRATYRNPVIDADYPDPDAVRVGDEYWMISSSFTLAPGLPVLRSSDLVRWEHVTNVLPALDPRGHFAVPQPGGGVWAPSLRHHDGRFVITYPDPDHGVFVTTATDPYGPWTTPHALLPGRGRIDPCPLWDDDGRAYLVHGWAGSRAGFKNRLTLVEVSPGLDRVVGPAVDVVDGDLIEGCTTLEGPKLYKRDGWYWIFAPAGGVATGWQSVFRSRAVTGPYEHRIVLAQGGTAVNGPHQGAWVDTPSGQDWFLHFQDRGPVGRVVHLQPMGWDVDGWPTMGEPGPDGVGRPVTVHTSPDTATQDGPARRLPYRDDPFTGPLAPQWAWQANPRPEWATGPADGALTLRAVADDTGDLRELPHVLGQRVPGQAGVVTVELDASALVTPGARAGLVVLGRAYSWVGVERRAGGARLVVRRSGAPGTREVVCADGPEVVGPVRLRVRVDGGATARFAWSTDTSSWQDAGDELTVVEGAWIGARLGVFAACPLGTHDGPQDVRVGPLAVEVDGGPRAAAPAP